MLQGVRRDKVVRVLIRLWDSDDLVVESKFQRAKPELAIGSKTALGIQWLVITSLGISGFDVRSEFLLGSTVRFNQKMAAPQSAERERSQSNGWGVHQCASACIP